MNENGIDTELDERVLRIMDALSGVDEILLDRCERKNKIIDYNSHEKAATGERRGFSGWSRAFGLRASGAWAAVLCLAVVGVVSWGGYRLTRVVNKNSASGGSSLPSMQSVSIAQDAAEEVTVADGEAAGMPENEAGAWNGAGEAIPGEVSGEGSEQGNGQGSGSTGDSIARSENLPPEDKEMLEQMQKIPDGAGENAEAEKDALDADRYSVSVDHAAPYEKLSGEAEARAVRTLGAYIPTALPGGYGFESAYRNQEEEWLRVSWLRGMDYIEISITAEKNVPATVDVGRPEIYDERLYEIPYGNSVPSEYWESFQSPVFALEDFGLEIVKSRMSSYTDSGDTSTPRGNFSVLYPDDVVVRFTGRGTAEEIWKLFESIGQE